MTSLPDILAQRIVQIESRIPDRWPGVSAELESITLSAGDWPALDLGPYEYEAMFDGIPINRGLHVATGEMQVSVWLPGPPRGLQMVNTLLYRGR